MSKTKRKQSRKRLWAVLTLLGVCVSALAVTLLFTRGTFEKKSRKDTIEQQLLAYMEHIPGKEYGEMYRMADVRLAENISEEDFIARNSAIYEGIEMQNMKVEVTGFDEERLTVTYHTFFDTVAGSIDFDNEAAFLEKEEGYTMVWKDSLILPELGRTDKVRVTTTPAERGTILDRNDRMLAGKGTASSVGIVPGKLADRESAINAMAELLELEPEVIAKKLEAKWVKEDSFVPVKTVPRVKEADLMTPNPAEKVLAEKARQDQLLAIPGVMISDTQVREYPYGQIAAHLVGYVQNVTAEDLEEHAGEGYTANSVIGRTGIEGLFEKELKGKDGCRIYLTDAEGNEKKELLRQPVQDGQTIKLTIDIDLQQSLFERFKEDKSCSVAMNPYTGEVLALVSTPSYDNNDFILGLSDPAWTELNEDPGKPLYNRFRQVWCPGSSFKPIVAAIGLAEGAIDPDEDYGNEGLSWQKDASWGSYQITTLHAYEPAVLENALIYSDNIYFAKAALRIGADQLETALTDLGFGEGVPFEIQMAKSQFSNKEKIETEIQLADSGYGQGQILINPLHMASIYTAFCNDGNVVKPRLVYEPEAAAEYWIPDAFSADVANRVLDGLKKVVSDPNGTGYEVYREDVLLAGKTGTAEIKLSKEDTGGTELGWFAVFTAERSVEKPVLIVSMVEDVKDRGGSGYVVEKDRQVLEALFGPE